MSKIINSDFKFWCPIEKAQEIDPSDGSEVWQLGGIASTIDKDSDGEFLDPKGFDIQPLMQSGLVNWHHQTKGQPAAIIGEPIEAELRPEGLWIKSNLYTNSKMAREVWELAETLEKNSKTRRLGYSIEGKVVKRKSNNKNHPDYKVIEKAIITGLAITHQPKNPKTFADIIKGQIEDDFEGKGRLSDGHTIESIAKLHGVNVKQIKEQLSMGTKIEFEHTDDSEEAKLIALDHLVELPDYYDRLEEMEEEGESEVKKDINTVNASALKKESVNKKIKKQTFSKSELIDRIFKDNPGVGINTAEKIRIIFNKIANMEGRKLVTEDDISKAYEALGIELSEDTILKAEEGDRSKKVKDEEEELDEKEAVENEDDEEDEEVEKGDDDDDFDDEIEEELEKAESDNRFDRFEKALATSHIHQTSYIKALGVLIKDASDKTSSVLERNAELLDIVKAQDEAILNLSSKLEEYGSSAPAPKSLRNARPVERSFGNDAEADITKGGERANSRNEVSMSRQQNVVAEILDQAAFNKGYDEEFSKACTHFEATKGLPANIIARIKNEMGINITK